MTENSSGPDTKVSGEEAYKSDELELSAFLLSLGCRLIDAKLRPDGVRSEFIITGENTYALVKEWDMGSSTTLVKVHVYRHHISNLRDTCTRLKKARRNN